MKILIGIALLVLLSACKNNDSNPVSNLSENPNDSGELVDINPEVPADGSAIEAPSYKIEVKWEHPGTRQDGSKLEVANIAEFTIYYGQDANQLDKKIRVVDSVNLSQIIELPSAGRWYISMSTIDDEGLESELSGIQTITIDPLVSS